MTIVSTDNRGPTLTRIVGLRFGSLLWGLRSVRSSIGLSAGPRTGRLSGSLLAIRVRAYHPENISSVPLHLGIADAVD